MNTFFTSFEFDFNASPKDILIDAYRIINQSIRGIGNPVRRGSSGNNAHTDLPIQDIIFSHIVFFYKEKRESSKRILVSVSSGYYILSGLDQSTHKAYTDPGNFTTGKLLREPDLEDFDLLGMCKQCLTILYCEFWSYGCGSKN